MTTSLSKAIPNKELNSGFSLPAYGLGTWGMGGTFSRDCSADDNCVAAIRRCLDNGVTHIDTAEMYGEGHAEELVGEAIRNHPLENLFLASKALGHHLRPDDLLNAAEASIDRMGCDYLDLYMIHHPSDEIPITETMAGFDELIRRGWIKNIGVANFTKERLAAAQKATRNKIAANQVHYSLTVRDPETTGLLQYCQQNDILLVAWQPIDRGVYAGASSPVLKKISETHGCSPVQAALAWVALQPNVTTICRTTSEDHLRENLEALELPLTSQEIETLRREYKPTQEKSDVYSLR